MKEASPHNGPQDWIQHFHLVRASAEHEHVCAQCPWVRRACMSSHLVSRHLGFMA